MRFTFSLENDKPYCTGLELVRPGHFRNLQNVCRDGALLFDGYTMHFRGESLEALAGEEFTISLRLLPLTFSAHGDGLVS